MTERSRARLVPGDDPGAPAAAAEVLARGGLIVFPTDTVYGVAAAVDHPEAVARLYHVKGRPLDRPIPVLVSDLDQVPRLTGEVDQLVLALLQRFWPGALTLAVPAAPWLPREIVRDTGRVGLRMPDHPLALAIIAAAGGALATTSANRSGEPEARTAAEAVAALGDRVDLIIDGGPAPGGVPSTVLVVDGRRLTVARRGALDPEDIVRAFPEFTLT